MRKLASYVRVVFVLSLFATGVCLVAGCAKEPEPQPTETKEERRLKEKEMMHREMNNK